MAEYQKKLNFSLKELVPFRADQLVREIKSASLEPNVICHEHGQYVILRGKLVFCGEYYPQNYEIQEDYFAEQNVADVFRNSENGYCTFNYAFPVDITIPQDRILSTEEISIGINNFDCSVQDNGFVSVNADLFVDGVYDREYVEHVRYQNQIQEELVAEIPALNVAESMNLENQFEATQDIPVENHFADFRNAQNGYWDENNYDQAMGPNEQSYINVNLNENEHNETAPNSRESYDEQIKYRTTYDYDPWNQNFNNNNAYSQADYYRNPYEATYQGGTETQYYNQPQDNVNSNEDTESDIINQYVTFSPTQKPEFDGFENSDYEIKFIPENRSDLKDEEALNFEQTSRNDFNQSTFETENYHEVQNEFAVSEIDEVAQFEPSGTIDSHEINLDVETPNEKRTDGYDKVVFPFADDDNSFGATDEYEFSTDTHIQAKTKPTQETNKIERPEIGKSHVVSDIFNVRGKEDKSSCLKIYIVQRGDSLEQLAEKYSTNASKIAHFNHLQLSDKILEGQVIYIPE